MSKKTPVIVYSDIFTAYGNGVNKCFDGLLENKNTAKNCTRFNTEHFIGNNACLIPETVNNNNNSQIMNMFIPMINSLTKEKLPQPEVVIGATTVGEIDLLENAVINNSKISNNDFSIDQLTSKFAEYANFNSTIKKQTISSACASSSTAIAIAAENIATGKNECICVFGADIVSEFIYAGFSSLRALSSNICLPFDEDRDGLVPGDGAGIMFIMEESVAIKAGLRPLAILSGSGFCNDANHMTGPSKDGGGLSQAINNALNNANIKPSKIESISAHGTGTIYNDAMEIKAFNKVFKDGNTPLYSIKGGTGHTMGAAGIIETAIAIKSLEKNIIPPTLNLKNPMSNSNNKISNKVEETPNAQYALSVNAGFGGINVALIIKKWTSQL